MAAAKIALVGGQRLLAPPGAVQVAAQVEEQARLRLVAALRQLGLHQGDIALEPRSRSGWRTDARPKPQAGARSATADRSSAPRGCGPASATNRRCAPAARARTGTGAGRPRRSPWRSASRSRPRPRAPQPLAGGSALRPPPRRQHRPSRPSRRRLVEGELAGGREVVAPGEVEDAVGIAPRHRLGGVGRAGVHDHDLVHRAGQAGQAAVEGLLSFLTIRAMETVIGRLQVASCSDSGTVY